MLFSFLVPPEPPEVVDPDGGASGMVRLSSTAAIVLITISKGRGTGIRLSSIIVQLRAIAGGCRVWVDSLRVVGWLPENRIENMGYGR